MSNSTVAGLSGHHRSTDESDHVAERNLVDQPLDTADRDYLNQQLPPFGDQRSSGKRGRELHPSDRDADHRSHSYIAELECSYQLRLESLANNYEERLRNIGNVRVICLFVCLVNFARSPVIFDRFLQQEGSRLTYCGLLCRFLHKCSVMCKVTRCYRR